MYVYFQQIAERNKFVLHFNEDATVKDAKEELSRTQYVFFDSLVLEFKSEILQDSQLLSEIQTYEKQPIYFYGTKVKNAPSIIHIPNTSIIIPPEKSKNENLEEDFIEEVISDKLILKLDKSNKTARVIDFISNDQKVFIPRSIHYKSQEYIITSISNNISYELTSIKFAPDSEISTLEDNNFAASKIETIFIHPGLKKISRYSFSRCQNLKSINFLPGSQLQIIENYAFSKSSIESILIPPSTTQICDCAFEQCDDLQKVEIPTNSELKNIGASAFSKSGIKILSMPSSVSEFDEGWCCHIKELNDITIFQSKQQNIMYFDDKFILKKSDPQSDVYDILLFARRDIKMVIIPPFIKTISSYAFEYCTSIEKIEFSENSELQEICCYAFHFSSIKNISFPPHLTSIGNNCFECCIHLKKVEFSENSELKSIGNQAFKDTIIENISIPLHLTTIGAKAFYYCKELKKVEIPENCELQTIGESAFFFTLIEKVVFTHHLTLIQECAFRVCENLKKLVLAPSSSLLTIENDLFGSSTPLEVISIPSSNIEFKEGWCSDLKKLTKIEIIPNGRQDIIYYEDKYILRKSNPDSDLYDILVFARRNIVNALIPSFIKTIEPFAFNFCKTLENVEIQENSELSLIGNNAFSYSSIKEIKIPSTLKKIGKNSFSCCSKLTRIEIPIDSQLTEIECEAFKSSNIKDIFIPTSVMRISSLAFADCRQLKKIEFTEDSNLTEIGKYCFKCSGIEQFSVPRNLVEISEKAFYICNKLRNVEFNENSITKKIGDFAFHKCPIEKISIPSSVTEIGEYPFSKNVKIIEIPPDSKIQTFGRAAFKDTSIGSLFIPTFVKIIKVGIFADCAKLQIIEIAENSQLERFTYWDLKDTIIMAPQFFNSIARKF